MQVAEKDGVTMLVFHPGDRAIITSSTQKENYTSVYHDGKHLVFDNTIHMMTIEYADEKEFRELERGLKKYNMKAYKELAFTHLPNLQTGKLKDAVRNGDVYEIDLPTDKFFEKINGKCKFVFKIEGDTITLFSIEPKEYLLSKLSDSRKSIDDDKFKITLLNRIDQDH